MVLVSDICLHISDTGDHPPIKVKSRLRLAQAELQAMNEQVDEWLVRMVQEILLHGVYRYSTSKT